MIFATRVRPHAGHAGKRRPRPSHLRLHGLDGRRRPQGRASSTARRTRSASTPWRIATTSPTSTRRSCTSSASIRGSWKSPAASGWTSTTGMRSRRSSPEIQSEPSGVSRRVMVSRSTAITRRLTPLGSPISILAVDRQYPRNTSTSLSGRLSPCGCGASLFSHPRNFRN